MARILRSYRSIAMKDHWCDRCCNCINPGDQYEAVVHATGTGRIIIWKYHVCPICEWPDDPVDEDEEVVLLQYVAQIRMAA